MLGMQCACAKIKALKGLRIYPVPIRHRPRHSRNERRKLCKTAVPCRTVAHTCGKLKACKLESHIAATAANTSFGGKGGGGGGGVCEAQT